MSAALPLFRQLDELERTKPAQPAGVVRACTGLIAAIYQTLRARRLVSKTRVAYVEAQLDDANASALSRCAAHYDDAWRAHQRALAHEAHALTALREACRGDAGITEEEMRG